MLNSGLNTGRAPNFPTPPSSINTGVTTMPNDLVADGRNFYTEIHFEDFRTANYGNAVVSTALNTPLDFVNSGVGAFVAGLNAVPGVSSLFAAGTDNLTSGLTAGTERLAAIRLPIPININDVMTFNWDTPSALDYANKFVDPKESKFLEGGALLLAQAGKSVNPLLFAAFNRPNFRSFRFEWNLVPRNKEESETIRLITETFKYAASPEGIGGPVLDYPLVAQVRMFPNNLNGHAYFFPMAVKGISVNLTPNPTPSFFDRGAPTMINLSVEMMEIKIWDRTKIKERSKIIGARVI
jgi:hypothetical protein